jgi:hypothetical protein
MTTKNAFVNYHFRLILLQNLKTKQEARETTMNGTLNACLCVATETPSRTNMIVSDNDDKVFNT